MYRMGELDFSGYLQSLGAILTVVVLIVGFIFTAFTLVLIEMADVTSALAQAILLVLILAFVLAWLGVNILLVRIQLLSLSVSEARPPSTPRWRFFDLLVFSSVLLMGISVSLMMFCRGLTYLGLVTVAAVVLTFAVYLIYISPYRLKTDQDKQAQQ